MKRQWSIQVFGKTILFNGSQQPVQMRGRKLSALLACLAYHAPNPVSREQLMEWIWPDTDIDSQRNRLNLTLSALRKVLEAGQEDNALQSDRLTVRLDLSWIWCDVVEFDRLIKKAAFEELPQGQLQCLVSAIELYRGPLLEELDVSWVAAERSRRSEQFTSASRSLSKLLEAEGNIERAVEVLRGALQDDPLNEKTNHDILSLLIRSGRHIEAARHYREFERVLDSELGVAPSQAIRTMMTRLDSREVADVANPVRSTMSEYHGIQELPASQASQTSPTNGRSVHPTARIGLITTAIALAFLIIFILVRVSNRPTLPRITGALAAVTRYHPISDETDSEPTSITTDSAGNIYTSGFVKTAKNDVDFLTLKYSSACKLIWCRRFNGAGNDCDRAYSLTVDGGGNVYVVGESYNGERDKGGTEWDMSIVKYDANGMELWHRAYNGTTGGDDRAIKVCLDRIGDVYVGGWSRTQKGQYQYVLVKYTPEGERLWVRPLALNSAPGFPIDAQPFDMVVDSTGNATITGEARIAGLPREKPHLAFLTLRYDMRGNLIWSKTYGGDSLGEAGARKVVIAPDGGIYVGGYGVNTRDPRLRSLKNFVVVRYDSQGNEKSLIGRVDLADRTERASEVLRGLAVDATGRIAVTGHKVDQTYMVTQFNNAGKLDSEFRFSNPISPPTGYGSDLAIDSKGYVCCTSYAGALPKGSTHVVTLKRSTKGESQWCRYYQAPVPGHNIGIVLTLDSSDNVIVAGRSYGGKTQDIVIIKYLP